MMLGNARIPTLYPGESLKSLSGPISPKKLLMHRFSDVPLALHPRVVPELIENIRQQMLEQQLLVAVMDAQQGEDEPPYDNIGGVAVIPVDGVLVNGSTSYFDESSYSAISQSFLMAMEDVDVNAIAFQICSPGGEVSGLFDLVDTIQTNRGKKAIWSIVDDYAYSAAYAIASATDKIVVPRTGGVGSIGCITMHLDVSGLLEQYGVNISLIHFGERKADYSPFKPLSETARKNLQGDVDYIGEMFVNSVARNRNMDRAKVKDTEAACFMGEFGVEAGLADAVMSPVAAFDMLSKVMTHRVAGPNGPRRITGAK